MALLITAILSLVMSPAGGAQTMTFPAECLYDSVFVKLNADYTAEISFKQQFLFNRIGGGKYSTIYVPINRYIDFTLNEVTTVLAGGRRIELGNKDIQTISDFEAGLYPESRTKVLNLPATRAGAVTIVSYKLTYKSLLYLPQFFRRRDIPTHKSLLEVASEIPYVYFASESDFVNLVTDSTIGFWAEDIPPYKNEINMPPIESYRIVVRPDTVIYGGHIYGFDSWADVAFFYNTLTGKRQKPDEKTIALADSLCFDAADLIDTLQSLFEFVRDSIRYVSLDLGRGEFTPLVAAEVLRRRYGDCKDQSALLTALYQAQGFKASPALITTRAKPEIVAPLPWPGYFDHVITAVDTGAGHLFLDASQATCCFGKLPSELRNRRALICGTEPFLDFTLTSTYDPGNVIDLTLNYKIGSQRDIRCDLQMKIYRDPAFMFYADSPDEVLSVLLKTFYSQAVVERYGSNFRVDLLSPDAIEISGNFIEKLPAPAEGRRLLIEMPSAFSSYLKKYFVPPPRTQTNVFDFTFRMTESIRYELSDGFSALKDSVVLSFNERGVHSQISLVCDDSLCLIDRSFSLLDYELSAERYNRFYDFLLIASQISYNSIEIGVEEIKPDVEKPGTY